MDYLDALMKAFFSTRGVKIPLLLIVHYTY